MGAFVALSVSLYRMSGGRIMGTFGGAPVLLLTTTGRKSGAKRTVPLLYVQDGACLVVVASYAGSPKHPAWYLNLEQNPKVELQVGRKRFAAVARPASADEKARLWPRLTAIYPRYEDYQKRTSREIPLVILIP
jgi:deazaflavin-dependent oxidoreductase (nitroreductase family)